MKFLAETRKSGKSFTKRQNRSGRSSVPCGTLHVTFDSGTHKLFQKFPIIYNHLENASITDFSTDIWNVSDIGVAGCILEVLIDYWKFWKQFVHAGIERHV